MAETGRKARGCRVWEGEGGIELACALPNEERRGGNRFLADTRGA